MPHVFHLLNLILGFILVAAVIAYAAIIIPIVLACVAGFCLALWLYAHVVDGVYYLSRRVQRWFSSRS
ncbi:hypothetical protein SAMN05216358_0040 [Rhizobium sp. AN5]|uniref:hypothetical protein n=1 Tax=Rhizobium sp. AN5 TaxID=1855304 RepID=UPI000BCB51EC|nr:hypothetical protein [Rhizobium sp. AN5]SOC90024.1 hypothetical protein SAMN05216358_0040 [Rhizobium sp. AN5]